MKLKEILAILTTRKGVSIPEISRETGISLQVLYNIRDGKTRQPQGKTIRRLAYYFGITPGQLVGEEPLIEESRYRGGLAADSTFSEIQNFIIREFIQGNKLVVPIDEFDGHTIDSVIRSLTMNKLTRLVNQGQDELRLRNKEENEEPR